MRKNNKIAEILENYGEKGVSILETLISLGLVGVISLMVSRSLDMTKKQVSFSRSDGEVSEAMSYIQSNILDKDICEANFVGPSSKTVTALVDDSGGNLIEAGDFGQSQVLSIVDFTTEKHTTNPSLLILSVKFSRNSQAAGTREVTKQVYIPVRYNSGDPSIVDECQIGQYATLETFESYTCDPSDPNDPGKLAGIYTDDCQKKMIQDTQTLTCGAGEYLKGLSYDPFTNTFSANCESVDNLEVAEEVDCSGDLLKTPDQASKCSGLASAEANLAFNQTVENCYGKKMVGLRVNGATDKVEIDCEALPPTTTTTTTTTTSTSTSSTTTTTLCSGSKTWQSVESINLTGGSSQYSPKTYAIDCHIGTKFRVTFSKECSGFNCGEATHPNTGSGTKRASVGGNYGKGKWKSSGNFQITGSEKVITFDCANGRNATFYSDSDMRWVYKYGSGNFIGDSFCGGSLNCPMTINWSQGDPPYLTNEGSTTVNSTMNSDGVQFKIEKYTCSSGGGGWWSWP